MQENIREILNRLIEDNLEKLSKLYVIRKLKTPCFSYGDVTCNG